MTTYKFTLFYFGGESSSSEKQFKNDSQAFNWANGILNSIGKTSAEWMNIDHFKLEKQNQNGSWAVLSW